ncbi:MAG: alpha/beta hydrolase [Anaerolineae bacterium]|nr:alpha/beta hydrolase [Anaerolineae bacterium]
MLDARMRKFYSQIPDAQKRFVEDFSKSHSQKSLTVDEVTWNYADSGKGKKVLLLLHGGYASFDMWMHQIVEFEKDYRIIAPTCPVLPDAKMRVYSDALYTILKAENIDNVNVMGYSEGGLIAQCFLRDYSATVNKAILAHTFYPSSNSTYYRHDFTLFRILPAFLTELAFKLLAQPDREELHHNATEWLEWYKGYFRELKTGLTKAMIITHIDLMIDFVRNCKFHPDDLSDWKGRMLITVAEDDIILRYFDGLKKLYPNAEYHMFSKGLGAHSLALISPKIFSQRIREFLEN